MPLAPLPDNGLIIAIGNTSAGIPIRLVTGEHTLAKKSIAPEALNIPIDTSMATRKGIILTAVLNPSLAPSVKASYTLTFLTRPYKGMNKRISGIAYIDI
jgi:hypothetical protein